MDQHIKEYFSEYNDDSASGNFHSVIPLHEHPEISWSTVSGWVPKLCKGWYELAHLISPLRIEFLSDYWAMRLPYHPELSSSLTRFFDSLDDIGIYITQRTFDDPHEAYLIYSRKNDQGFFRGSLGASDEDILKLQSSFPSIIFPEDYLAFLRIHNRFSKTTDSTGIIPTQQFEECYKEFQNLIMSTGEPPIHRGVPVDPTRLLPFYESFGMPFFQCFWADWYPEHEMGNVYYSSTTQTISDIDSSDPLSEGMAFPTFLDWLFFYLESVE